MKLALLTLLAWSLTPFFTQAMEQTSSVDFTPMLRALIRIDHPVNHAVVTHYSVYKAHHVSTFINLKDAGPNYYLARTISNYPKEGLRVTYSGTREIPTLKIVKVKTGTRYDFREIPIISSEAIPEQQARALFKDYINRYQLLDRPAQDWLRK